MLTFVMENIKVVGSAATGLVAVTGAYVHFEGPIPVTDRYVLAQLAPVQRSLIDSRLQLNTMRQESVRQEKFRLELSVPNATNPDHRNMLQMRIQDNERTLKEIERDDARLLEERSRIK